MLREINFDGIVGPSHNYAGLSLGNLASARNFGSDAHPRAAALQGIGKMSANLDLGLAQGILLPHPRPDDAWLATLATCVAQAEPGLRANALSAAAMWAANAATVSPAPDTGDQRCHLTVANLMTMPHRSHEWQGSLAQLRVAFADPRAFVVHPPVPPPFGDEGAANHMRLCERHDAPGVEVFVYGRPGGRFPARQHEQASAAIARAHRLDPARVLLVEQSPAAIAAGAFHNDVVAVANRHVLLVHEQAFAEPEAVHAALRRLVAGIEIIVVPASEVSLDEAVASYLFNAQLVDLADRRDTQDGTGGTTVGAMALILPEEACAATRVRHWLERLVAGNGPIRRLVPVDLRQSMANGGGPACLRLRVVADPASVDPRFMVDRARLDAIAAVVTRHWPETIAVADLTDPALWPVLHQARRALLATLDLAEELA